MKVQTISSTFVALGIGASCALGLGLVNAQPALATSTQAQLQSKEAQAAQIRAQLQELGAQADTTNDKIYELETQLKETEEQIAQITQKITDTKQELEDTQAKLAKRVSASYKAGNTNFIDVLVGASNFDDFVSRMHYAQSIADNDADMIKKCRELKEQLEESEISLSQRKEEQSRLIAQNKESVAQLQSYMDESQQILNGIDQEISQLMEKQRQEEEARKQAAYQAQLQKQAQEALKAQEAAAKAAKDAEAKQKRAAEELKRAQANGANKQALEQARRAQETAERQVQAAQKQTKAAESKVNNVTKQAGGNASIVEIARGFTGASYRQPYEGVDGGLDCSGLVTAVYQKKGVNLPRSSAAQYAASQSQGWAVSQNDLQPGDLIFYKKNGSDKVGHVAIYTGNGKAMQAYNPGRPAGEGSMNMDNWSIVGYGRPGANSN